MVYNIVKAFFAPQFRKKSINMPHKALWNKIMFLTFARARSSISNEAQGIISEQYFIFTGGHDETDSSKLCVLSRDIISFAEDVELE